ncbi:MAG TPA: zinc-ribbon domain-containing protein [Anaeromyxobacteraceae bacterium]|nr:zinc-ribbon domain-containing protein [Anaeromyxobacteraceae bacterium]
MIVVCTSCRARFRIADDKIGPRGARVRCSKCRNAFTVGPPPPAEKAATGVDVVPPLPVREDPFAASAPGLPEAEQATDPFAGFLSASPAPAPEPPPLPGAEPAPPDVSAPMELPPFLGSLPVTNLADLERTGARAFPGAEAAAVAASAPDADLSLEERTPVGIPALDGMVSETMPTAADPFEGGFPFPEAVPGLESGTPAPPEPTPAVAPAVVPPPLPPPAAASRASAPHPPAEPEAPRVARPPPVEEPAPVESDAFAAKRLRGVFLNALSLALLLVFTAGILLWWRGESVLTAVRRAGHAAPAPLSAVARGNGYYEASSGRLLVVLRGEVRSEGQPAAGPVRVSAEMLQGGTVVARAEGLAGAVPTAEELAALGSREDADRLLQAVAPRAARRVVPGQEVPFLVTFVDYPAYLGDVTFRVAARPAGAP